MQSAESLSGVQTRGTCAGVTSRMGVRAAVIATATSGLSASVSAAVPVSGFTVESATVPFGLLAMAVALVALGLYNIRSSR